ncbi:hypothetical protein C8J57DRAFT_1255651 [Mycena rebaudengoi]|nr:hypothetical protein C8J57DRAFT_1255651 [Mycena rebaudengoi]
MDPELAVSELLVAVRALKAVEKNGKNKLSKLKTQVKSLKAEMETLNHRLAVVTTSEQKLVQKCEELTQRNQELKVAPNKKSAFFPSPLHRAGLERQCEELKEKNKKLIIALNKMPAHRADLQRVNATQCEELTERNKELTIALNKKPVPHADLQRQCEELAEKNQELIITLNKRPAPPPSGPSAAKWKARCEKLKEEYLALQLCYQELKTEFHDLDQTYREYFAGMTHGGIHARTRGFEPEWDMRDVWFLHWWRRRVGKIEHSALSTELARKDPKASTTVCISRIQKIA